MPLYYLDEALLITTKRTNAQKMENLLILVMNFWPLLLIGILMATTAGFVMWLMETWSNEREFRRPFIQGMFDGFWWGFVSMTTVGYGDKCPRSIKGRLFSVLWITSGIIIFSMLTAAMTEAIKTVEQPTNGKMNSAEIGILRGRLFETKIVIHSGGSVIEGESITELLKFLADGKIQGILVDLPTKFVLFNEALEEEGLHHEDYLATIVKLNTKNVYAYGALFRYESDWNFFEEVVHNYASTGDICVALRYGHENKVDENTGSIFHINSGFFWSTFATLSSIISCTMLFGLIYEWHRRRIDAKTYGDAKCPAGDTKAEIAKETDFIKTNVPFTYDNPQPTTPNNLPKQRPNNGDIKSMLI